MFHRHDFGRLSAAETMLTEAIELAADCRSADRAIQHAAIAQLVALLTGLQVDCSYRHLPDKVNRHQRNRRISRLFVG